MYQKTDEEIKNKKDVNSSEIKTNEDSKEITLEDKLKDTEDKLLRSLAEIENQRRRFEKEIRDAFEFVWIWACNLNGICW